MASAPEAMETMAYTRFVLERGLAGDLLDSQVALAPCLVGYGESGERLLVDPAPARPQTGRGGRARRGVYRPRPRLCARTPRPLAATGAGQRDPGAATLRQAPGGRLRRRARSGHAGLEQRPGRGGTVNLSDGGRDGAR